MYLLSVIAIPIHLVIRKVQEAAFLDGFLFDDSGVDFDELLVRGDDVLFIEPFFLRLRRPSSRHSFQPMVQAGGQVYASAGLEEL